MSDSPAERESSPLAHLKGQGGRTRFLLVVFSVAALSTSILGVLADRTSAKILREESLRATGIAVEARRGALLAVLEWQQTRLGLFVNSVLAACGAHELSTASCLEGELGQLLRTEGARGAKLWQQNRALATVGSGHLTDVVAAFKPPQIAQFIHERTPGPATGLVIKSESNDGRLTVALVFDVSQLRRIFVHRCGLGASGEIFLVGPRGFFVTPPWYQHASGSSHPLDALAMRRCLQREDGETLGSGYRGVEVIHSLRYVPELGDACIMARIEPSQAFASNRTLTRLVLTMLLLLSAGSAALALLLTRTISKPLRRLTDSARALRGGEHPVPLERGPQSEQPRAVERTVLMSVFTNAPACICVLRGPNHVFELANPPYRELLGERDIVGLPAREAVPELEALGYFRLLDQVYETGEPFVGKELLSRIDRRRNGQLEDVYFNFVYQPLFGADGKPDGIIAFGFDVTEQVLARRALEALARERERLIDELKQAAEERQQSEERYRLAVEATQLGTYDFNQATGAMVCNDRWYEIFNLSRGSEVTEQTFYAAIHPDDRVRVEESVTTAVRAQRTQTFELEYRVGAGRGERWVRTRGRVYFDDNQRAGRVVGTVLDTTGRKRVEREQQFLLEATAALNESLQVEATLKRIATLSVPGIADICVAEMVGNDGTLYPLSVAHRDAVREPLLNQLLQTEEPDVQLPFGPSPVIVNGRTELIEDLCSVLPQEGKRRRGWALLISELGALSYIAVPLRARGKVIGALSYLRTEESDRHYSRDDMAFLEEFSNRCALALENAELFQRAQEAVRIRDDFLSVASHELRTPLTTLHLQLDLLARGVNSQDERLSKRVRNAVKQTSRLTQLAETLLDVSRITSGRLHLQMEELELADLVNEVVERFQDEANAASCKLVFEPAPHPIRGAWDRMRLEHVVSNLLSNAIKYGPGKPIEVSLSQRDGTATIAVKDRGIGIAAQDLLRIFGRFERAVPTTHYGGLGLGLFIARQIVEAHGGTIEVHSRPDEGSTFVVLLPVVHGSTDGRISQQRPS